MSRNVIQVNNEKFGVCLRPPHSAYVCVHVVNFFGYTIESNHFLQSMQTKIRLSSDLVHSA